MYHSIFALIFTKDLSLQISCYNLAKLAPHIDTYIHTYIGNFKGGLGGRGPPVKN